MPTLSIQLLAQEGIRSLPVSPVSASLGAGSLEADRLNLARKEGSGAERSTSVSADERLWRELPRLLGCPS